MRQHQQLRSPPQLHLALSIDKALSWRIQSQTAANRKACRIRRWHHGRIIYHSAIKNDSSAILEPTEWQRIGDEIDTALVFARADFVSVHR